MISYGFFNSVGGDRTYNADDMNEVAKGLISDNGVFANVGGQLQVVATTGLNVGVSSGRGRVNGHWLENDSTETITLAASDVTRNRYDAIVLRYSATTRDITLTAIQGTLATTPTKPDIVRTAGTFDICLAYVYVGRNVTAITQSAIEDARLNTDVCGYITGLVEQIDTSQFFAQMMAWENEVKTEFETWLTNLTQELQIGTYIQEYENTVDTTANETVVSIGISQFDAVNDVLFVNLNGVVLVKNEDYNVSGTGANAAINLFRPVDSGNRMNFRVLKSVIGIRS